MTTDTSTTALDRLLSAGLDPLSPARRDEVLRRVGDEPAPTKRHHLAQMNIARFKGDVDDPAMTEFVEMLDPINNHADAAPGFVWRLMGEGDNNAMSLSFYDDPLLLVNLSVWTDLESLRDFVYRSEHLDLVRRRHEWAIPMEQRYLVLWWIPAGHIPEVAEGDARLRHLQAEGPTQEAFTFGQAFPPPPANET